MKNDGGPAFPRPIGNNGATHWGDREVNSESEGMSLRDWFAGMALLGMVNKSTWYCDIAAEAYRVADAMLAERDKEPK